MYRLRESETQFKKLRYFPVFEHFTDEEFQDLFNNFYERSYKKGQILFSEGDIRNRVYFLVDGLVRLERYDESATFNYFDYVKKMTLFPYGGMFSDKEYHYSAQALSDIRVFYLPVEVFERNCLHNPKQLLFMYRKLSKILMEHELRIQTCIASSAYDRVYQTLEYLKNSLSIQNSQGDQVIPYPITLAEIAINSGTTRETAGHIIKELKAQRIIAYDNKIFVFFKKDDESH